MASRAKPDVPMDDAAPLGAALQHSHWRKLADLASGLARVEQFLERAGFEALLDTTDKTEGIRAFREKRKPGFIGR